MNYLLAATRTDLRGVNEKKAPLLDLARMGEVAEWGEMEVGFMCD